MNTTRNDQQLVSLAASQLSEVVGGEAQQYPVGDGGSAMASSASSRSRVDPVGRSIQTRHIHARSETMSNSLETVHDLSSVVGGNGHPGFNLGQCFDSVWPWSAGGATAGKKGAAGGAAAGFLTSPACGNGVVGPSTLLRQGVQHTLSRFWQPGGETPYEKGRFGPIFGK